jgi:diguanylate cyclase (GGDEF)-like protein
MNELIRRSEDLDLESLELLDHDGRVLAHSDPDVFGVSRAADPFVQRALKTTRPQVQRQGGLPSRVAVPVHTGIRWATLIGTISDERLEARITVRIKRLVGGALAIGLLGLFMLLLFLQSAVIDPVRNVGKVARRFAEGDLDARSPVAGPTEIATVATALNAAAERLGHYTEELETEVKRRTEELEQKNVRLQQLATTDGLTELVNHRRFYELLSSELVRQRREMKPFALLMIDVDHFKNYNDSHGHPAGDGVLKRIAQILRENTRASDVVARYGGEEFGVLLLDTDLDSAQQIAEKLREMVAGHPFPHAEEQPLGCVSISIGVAAWPDHGTTPETLVEAADQALYAAKAFGRDVVVPAHEKDTGEATA